MEKPCRYDLSAIKRSLELAETLASVSLMTSPAAKRRLQARSVELGLRPGQPYEPPRELLLYLVRMGSFTSSVKIDNEDSQDKDLTFENHVTYQQLLEYCRAYDNQWPNSQLIKRTFTSIPYDPDSVEGNPVRVLQWNVLSQALGQNNDRFDSCPLEALEWKHRRCHMLEEILRHNPDIICLQEVDHFDFLSRALATQSYSGLFVPKPDSPCVYINDNNGPDGCAIFYKNDKFDLLEKHDKILQVWTVHSNQVSLLLILQDKSTQKELCVSTTHLKARKGALLSTLRNEQGKDLLQFISSHAAGRPTIVCGDFNAEPTEPVYNTMCSCSYLPLDSAYKLSGSEPLYTSWKIRGGEGEVKHTIDYMFYTKHKLTVSNILNMPKEIDIGENRVPSLSYPSDHFSLISDFYFNKNTSGCD
ncbi:nocturnin isoform X1 [Melanaphis sacchari]|uniref:Nocturnin n=2 Tax=Melanaphis sacchari TaxID=742174 RepID=A0A2H8TV35_9HEMI|nr:nocturnin isoform X1 [Melanaphis sacchari]XP_025196415.1 nocturnin isoform X1 [Melanaphis sacchari]